MSKIYLVTLRPLEPYFFGDGKNLNFPNQSEKLKTEYYVESLKIPSQSTLLGALRYMVLKKCGQLNSDGSLSLNKEQKELVGERGFSIHNNATKYGVIEKIGSVFLLDKENHCYIPCPLNSKKEDAYKPFRLTNVKTGNFCKTVPLDYDAKGGLNYDGWIGLKDQELVVRDNMFLSREQVGILKEKKLTEKAFFKRKYYMLNNCFKFAFFIQLNETFLQKDGTGIWEDILMMGQKQSTFSFKCQEVACSQGVVKEYKSLLTELGKIQKEGTDLTVYYAASPVIFKEQPECEFYISENKTFQYTNPKIRKSSDDNKLKTDVTYISKAGSVFYLAGDEQEQKFKNSYDLNSCITAGFNKIYKLEDNENEFKIL